MPRAATTSKTSCLPSTSPPMAPAFTTTTGAVTGATPVHTAAWAWPTTKPSSPGTGPTSARRSTCLRSDRKLIADGRQEVVQIERFGHYAGGAQHRALLLRVERGDERDDRDVLARQFLVAPGELPAV